MTRQKKHSTRTPVPPRDPRDPGVDYLLAELRTDRLTERWIILKAVIALTLVGVLVIIRQVYFV